MIWHYGAEIQAQALFILQLHLNAVIWNGCLICLPPEVRLLLILRFTFESVGTCKRIMRPGEKSRQKKALLSFPFETALKKKMGQAYHNTNSMKGADLVSLYSGKLNK